jgi:hypothetical protein
MSPSSITGMPANPANTEKQIEQQHQRRASFLLEL